MARYYEFDQLATACSRWAELTRLGWRPFSIFQTASGRYAFHLP